MTERQGKDRRHQAVKGRRLRYTGRAWGVTSAGTGRRDRGDKCAAEGVPPFVPLGDARARASGRPDQAFEAQV